MKNWQWLLLGIVCLSVFAVLALPLFNKKPEAEEKSFLNPELEDLVSVGAETTYYWNSYSVGERWAYLEGNMVDGNIANFAYTDSASDVQLNDGNTYSSGGVGTISKVEIRAYAKTASAAANDLILRPVFSGITDCAGTYTFQMDSGLGAWSGWFDITSDGNAPSWTWTEINTMDMDVEADLVCAPKKENYVSKIELRVTTEDAPTPEYANFTITQSSTPLHFNSSSATNYNVNASSQTSSICALNISNDEGFPINITIALNNSIGNGIHLKWANIFTPPNYSTSYDNWYQKRKNSVQHASTSGGTAPIANNTVFTINATGSGEIRGTPLIVDNMLYVCGFGDTTNGGHDNISAWYISNHTMKWAYDINGSRGSPLYYNDCIYVSSTPDTIADARFYCIWASNGTLRWEKDVTNSTILMGTWQCSPSVDVETNQVFIPHGTYLHAFNATTGDWNWHINFTALGAEDPMAGIPTVDTDFVYYQTECNEGTGNGTHCIWKNNGTVKWNLTGNVYCNPKGSPIVVGDYVYIASRGGKVYKIHRINGTEEDVWEVGGNSPVGGLSYHNGVIFASMAYDSSPKIHAIYTSNMTEKWNYSGITATKFIECSPAIADGYVYFTATDGYVRCLWENNGTLCWNYSVGTKTESDIAISDGILAFNANNWSTYILGTQSIYNASSSDYYETDDEIEVGTVEEHPKDKVVRTLAGSSYELVYLWADFYGASTEGEITRIINVTSRNTTMGAYSYDEVTLKFNYTYIQEWEVDLSYWISGGNDATDVLDLSYWISGGNTSTNILDLSYWISGGNDAVSELDLVYWVSGGNETSEGYEVDLSYWISGGNDAISELDLSYWISGGHTANDVLDLTYWISGGNDAISELDLSYWISGGNETPGAYELESTYWISGGNITDNVLDMSYWISGGNDALSQLDLVYWISGGNDASNILDMSYWISGGNEASDILDLSYWISGGNESEGGHILDLTYWISGGNVTDDVLDLTYWISGGNVTDNVLDLSYWISGGNDAADILDLSYWISGGNVTDDVLDLVYWISGGNETEEGYFVDLTYWISGGNVTDDVLDLVYWISGGNTAADILALSYWISGGNDATSVLDLVYWISGGNISLEGYELDLSYWISGGNVTDDMLDITYWISGGNETPGAYELESTYWISGGNDFDAEADLVYWISGGNVSATAPELTSYYPANGSTGIAVPVSFGFNVTDGDGENMTINVSSNRSGSWQVFATYSNVTNGSYYFVASDFNLYNTTYYWFLNITDESNISYESGIFSFTTTVFVEDAIMIYVLPVGDYSGLLLAVVFFIMILIGYAWYRSNQNKRRPPPIYPYAYPPQY